MHVNCTDRFQLYKSYLYVTFIFPSLRIQFYPESTTISIISLLNMQLAKRETVTGGLVIPPHRNPVLSFSMFHFLMSKIHCAHCSFEWMELYQNVESLRWNEMVREHKVCALLATVLDVFQASSLNASDFQTIKTVYFGLILHMWPFKSCKSK